MRKDMFEVIIERPRTGGYNARPTHYLITGDGEHIPKYESMKYQYYKGYATKQLNENLKPLYRFIGKQVGRPWNDVWSEICEHLDDSSAVKKHVKDHAATHVDQNVKMIDGEPYIYYPRLESKRVNIPTKNGTKYQYESIGGFTHRNGWIPLSDKRFRYLKEELYINSDTGILTAFKRPKHKIPYNKNARDYPYYKTTDGNEYRYLKGIWYYVTITTIKYKELKNATLWVDGKYITNPNAVWVEKTRVVENTQQLNKKDKRRLIQWIETGVWGPPQKKQRGKVFKKI